MRCHDFETRLNDVLDRRLAPKEDHDLRVHARRCEKCAEMLSAYSSLAVGLTRLAGPEPDAGFSFRVMHSVSVGGASRVSVGGTGRRDALAEPVAPVRQRRRVTWYRAGGFVGAAAAALVAVVMLRSQDFRQLPAKSTRLIANLNYGNIARQTGQFASAFASPHIVLVGQLAEGFEPMRDSFYAALDALKRTLPVEQNHTQIEIRRQGVEAGIRFSEAQEPAVAVV